jgi:putative glutamine amidotransferase
MAARVGVTFCGDQKVEAYEGAVRAVGLEPVRLIAGQARSLDGLYGLLLTGGTDVNPRRYGQIAAPETQQPDEARDEMECSLLGEALAIDLPVFAICRGMQVLNVQMHGTLQQHLPPSAGHEQRHPDEQPRKHRDAHTVSITAGTLLSRIVGQDQIAVNSRHHQGVDRLGSGVIASALSSDGIIEAIEHPRQRFVLGVQWHPEDRIEISDSDLKLFEAFAKHVASSK